MFLTRGSAEDNLAKFALYGRLYASAREGQIRSLVQQVFPTQAKYFLDAWLEATKKEHCSLLLGLHALTPDRHRVRSTIINQMSWKFMHHLDGLMCKPLIYRPQGI